MKRGSDTTPKSSLKVPVIWAGAHPVLDGFFHRYAVVKYHLHVHGGDFLKSFSGHSSWDKDGLSSFEGLPLRHSWADRDDW